MAAIQKKLSEAEQKRLLEALEKRKKENEGKQIDNSSLYAGSAMYYYCKVCGAHTDTLAESDFFTKPKRTCDPCKEMLDYGYSVAQGRFLELA
jgi:hypothetical protein